MVAIPGNVAVGLVGDDPSDVLAHFDRTVTQRAGSSVVRVPVALKHRCAGVGIPSRDPTLHAVNAASIAAGAHTILRSGI